MTTPDREDIHLISRHAAWDAAGARKVLAEQVYNDKQAWQKFLERFFLAAGIGFLVAGILFFFAYNWQSLHKFVKIGLIEGLLIALVLLTTFTRLKLIIKQILLTGATVMVGILMAVFGQVYQTGADAYDLFLAWTLAVSIWAFTLHFAPLWLIYLTLINLTVFLYSDQVAYHWPKGLILLILFLFNSAYLLINSLLARWRPTLKAPDWLLYVVTLGALSFSTVGFIEGILDWMNQTVFAVLAATAVLLYSAGLYYGFRQRKLFYLAVIPISVILIIATLMVKQSAEAAMILLVCLFIIGSITLLVRWLIKLQKTFSHEERA